MSATISVIPTKKMFNQANQRALEGLTGMNIVVKNIKRIELSKEPAKRVYFQPYNDPNGGGFAA